MDTQEKTEQEAKSLNNIGDSFKKFIVVKDNIKLWRNEDGILIIGVQEFLLNKNSLETKEERHFYLKLSIKNNYSKRELDRQISSSYYERYMLSDGKQLPIINKTIDEDDYPNTKILLLHL